MRADVRAVTTAMARREAAAALLPPPLVETGATGPSVRVSLVVCPACGTREHDRPWAPPFTGDVASPVLFMLACETVTARAVLPIVVMALRRPDLAHAEFTTRGLTWLEVAHLRHDKALAAVDAAERWITDPGATGGHTLPASTRHYRPGATWPRHRGVLVPSFISPHPAVPAPLERLYAAERRAAVVANCRRSR